MWQQHFQADQWAHLQIPRCGRLVCLEVRACRARDSTSRRANGRTCDDRGSRGRDAKLALQAVQHDQLAAGDGEAQTLAAVDDDGAPHLRGGEHRRGRNTGEGRKKGGVETQEEGGVGMEEEEGSEQRRSKGAWKSAARQRPGGPTQVHP